MDRLNMITGSSSAEKVRFLFDYLHWGILLFLQRNFLNILSPRKMLLTLVLFPVSFLFPLLR